MKKIISAMLAIAMTASLAVNAFATQASNTFETETGVYYCFTNTLQNDDWETVVYRPNNGDDVRIDTRAHSSDAIYSIELDDVTISQDSIDDIVSELANSMLDAEVSYVSDFVSDNTTSMHSSAEEDLIDALCELHGNEYSGKVLKTYYTADFPKVSRIQVKADLFYRVNSYPFYFAVGTSLSKIALSLCGYSTPLILSIIADILDITDTVQTELSGTKYDAIANFGRYCYVNGTSTIYNDTYRIIRYVGLDPKKGRARIINEDQPSDNYSDGKSYFNSYYDQASDAYDAYLGN